MKKVLFALTFVCISAVALLILNGCETLDTSSSTNETPSYSVTYMNGNEEVFKMYVHRNSTASRYDFVTPPIGYDFNGVWLLDNRVYDFNSPVRQNIVLEASFTLTEYNISFYNGTTLAHSFDYTINSMSDFKEPPSPQKPGYTSAWEEYTLTTSDVIVRAVFTPIIYEAKFYNGETLVDTVEYTVEMKSIIEPAVPPLDNQVGAWESYELSVDGVTVHAIYTPLAIAANFYADGKLYRSVPYTLEEIIQEPIVPPKSGYTGTWSEYELTGESVRIDAIYTPINYSVKFVADGKIVDTASFTVEDMEIAEPSVPGKIGYSGAWESYTLGLQNITINAVYTLITYTATFVADGKTVSTIPFTIETESITEPNVPTKTGYNGRWSAYTLGSSDITVTAVYTPIEYTATFIADGKTVAISPFNVETDSITEPNIPDKIGYSGAWESYTLSLKNITVNAVYTLNTYNATFVADGEVVKTERFTIETETITEPNVPTKTGYNGRWSAYILGSSDITITAVYTPIKYTVTFMDGENVVARARYTIENRTISEPATPSKTYYTAAWEEYSLNLSDINVQVIFTPIIYTATFIASGKTVGSEKFTVEDRNITEPRVPEKAGYSGAWEHYTLKLKDLTITAIYTPITYTATYVADGKTVDERQFTVENRDVDLPEIPEKVGYNGYWTPHILGVGDLTINAIYTPIPYTATFIADGEIFKVKFTVETKDDFAEPEVPHKEGFIGEWQDYEITLNNFTVQAVYTSLPTKSQNFTVVFIADGEEIDRQTVGNLDNIQMPTLADKLGYTSSWEKSEDGTTITYTAKYTPIKYTATFKVGNETIGTANFTIETESITEPNIPEKDGYTAAWTAYTLGSSDITVTAVYTPIEYTATFVADGKTISTEIFTVEDMEIIEPNVPQKIGHSGAWESYTLSLQDITVNAVYTLITYTATFEANGKTVATIPFNIETETITEPTVPMKTGYTAAWTAYILGSSDITITAVYTPITYFATFKADDRVIATVAFTVESESLSEPAVPNKEGFVGVWESYEIVADDITIHAVYTAVRDDRKYLNFVKVEGGYAVSGLADDTVTELVIPSTFYDGLPIVAIGNYAFKKCSITSIVIPSSVKTIGTQAFNECTLTKITLSEGLETIGDHAFYKTSVVEIVIPDTVTSIGKYAFSGCASLTKVTIGTGVMEIKEKAFSSCTALKEIIFKDPSNWYDKTTNKPVDFTTPTTSAKLLTTTPVVYTKKSS